MSESFEARAWVLNVGHGSSTVIEEDGCVVVIDGGRGDALLRFLSLRGIARVDTVLVSHVDADHLGGLSLLLSSPEHRVDRVFVNPDRRDTALWRDFVSVMIDAKKRGSKFKLELTSVNPGKLLAGGCVLEVLGPSQELASRTADGQTAAGRRLNPNALSAVVRVWAGESPRLLLAGEIDRVGFDELRRDCSGLEADVLVFPHHGGLPGNSDPSAFAEEVTNAVEPKLVVFSIGRSKNIFPRPEIVTAVMKSAANVHIACTQLSKQCAVDVPAESRKLNSSLANDASGNTCCAGTLEVSLAKECSYAPARTEHREFIDENAPSALCR